MLTTDLAARRVGWRAAAWRGAVRLAEPGYARPVGEGRIAQQKPVVVGSSSPEWPFRKSPVRVAVSEVCSRCLA
jgi:hypothetical protein